jgi:hypothetical protein
MGAKKNLSWIAEAEQRQAILELLKHGITEN